MTTQTTLHHVWTESDHDFFKRIDECGGWPVGFQYVAFYHDEERRCEFINEHVRNGWWTTIANADDYYWWKISDKAKATIRELHQHEFFSKIRGLLS